MAILSSGIGKTQADKFLAALNIPLITNRNHKKREREIGPIVESVAKRSCKAACTEERTLTLQLQETGSKMYISPQYAS